MGPQDAREPPPVRLRSVEAPAVIGTHARTGYGTAQVTAPPRSGARQPSGYRQCRCGAVAERISKVVLRPTYEVDDLPRDLSGLPESSIKNRKTFGKNKNLSGRLRRPIWRKHDNPLLEGLGHCRSG